MIPTGQFKTAKKLERQISDWEYVLNDVERGEIAPVAYGKRFGAGFEHELNNSSFKCINAPEMALAQELAKTSYIKTIEGILESKRAKLAEIVEAEGGPAGTNKKGDQ